MEISLTTLMWAMLPTYGLILFGMLLRAIGVIKDEHDQSVMYVAIQVMYPCFILDKILGSTAFTNLSSVLWPLCLGISVPILSLALGWLLGRCMKLERGTGLRTFALSSGVQNFGYTAIPVIQQLWPMTGALAILFVHNLGMELVLWSIGVMWISGNQSFHWKKLINGPLIAVVVGLTCIAFKWNFVTVGPHREAMKLLGASAFPLALTMIGSMMYSLVKTEFPSVKIISLGLVMRLILCPALILTLAKYLPIAVPLKQVLVVQSAMPSGMTSILLCRLYHGRPAIAVHQVLFTTVLSVFSLPLILAFGIHWVFGA